MEKNNPENEEKRTRRRKPEPRSLRPDASTAPGSAPSLAGLQHQVGNRAVQRLLAQRSTGFELDDETAGRIQRQRGGGQPLDGATGIRMSDATGFDFSGVRVHTSPEAAGLSRQLSAKAFTTGQDIFFSEGAYQPGSTGGQELLAHELTHVVQQSSGEVGGAGRMAVNAPGDAFEQEADAVAEAVLHPGPGEVQRQEEEDEESLDV